jgi:hypothetical protein
MKTAHPPLAALLLLASGLAWQTMAHAVEPTLAQRLDSATQSAVQAKRAAQDAQNRGEQQRKIKVAVVHAKADGYKALDKVREEKSKVQSELIGLEAEKFSENQSAEKKANDDLKTKKQEELSALEAQEKAALKLLLEMDELEISVAKADQANSFFDPGNWAVGIAMMKNRPSIVSEAEVDAGGIVRAKTIESTTARLLLIRQYYVSKTSSTCSPYFCPGVFVGVGLGGGSNAQLIDTLGFGVLWGSNDNTGDAESGRKHNFGIGWGRRFGIKLLDETYVPGQAAPGGSKAVQFQTRDIAVSPFLMYSYKF